MLKTHAIIASLLTIILSGCNTFKQPNHNPIEPTKPTFLVGQDPLTAGKKWAPIEYMSDEFNGTKVNLKKWQIEPNQNTFTWIGRPPGLFRAENVSVQNGDLCIEVDVLDEPFTNSDGTYLYSGGIVRSLRPGNVGDYFECRMKANATEMSSTFWLLSIGGPSEAQELDIQECVGKTSELTKKWARNWDHIFHSNAIHWRYFTEPNQKKSQDWVELKEKNHERYFIYGAWWKSEKEIQFFLDGKYMYSINPKESWEWPGYLHMAIETYDWNPVPADGGMIASGTKNQRTTRYDWIRSWKVVSE